MQHLYHYHFVPGKTNSSADPVGIPQYPCGDDVTQGFQHVLQLLLIHRNWQVGDVQVGGVLLLLLKGQEFEEQTGGTGERRRKHSVRNNASSITGITKYASALCCETPCNT